MSKKIFFISLFLFILSIVSGGIFVFLNYFKFINVEFDVVLANKTNDGIIRISPNSDMLIDFTTDVDKSSLKENIKIIPSIKYEVNVVKNQIFIKPLEKLNIGDNYTVILSKNIRSTNGKSLNEDYYQVFEIVDYPNVSLFTPIKYMENPLEDSINIVFNKQLVALGSKSYNVDFLKNKIKIIPNVEGTWQIKGVNTVSFLPKEKFKYNTNYKVILSKDIYFYDNSFLQEDKVFEFNTPYLYLDNIDINFKGSDNNLIQAIFYTKLRYSGGTLLDENSRFNANISLYEINDKSIFDNYDKTNLKVLYKNECEHLSGNLITTDVKIQTGIYIVDKLNLKKVYALKFTDIYSDYSSSKLDDTCIIFNTPSDLKVLSTFPANYENTYNLSNIEIIFNNEIKDNTLSGESLDNFINYLSGHILIEPNVEYKDIYFNANIINISTKLNPGTKYKVTIKSGIKDVFNNILKEDYVFSFTTNDLKPEFSFLDYNDIKILPINKNPSLAFYTVNMTGVLIDLCDVDIQSYIQSKNTNLSFEYKSINEMYEKMYDIKTCKKIVKNIGEIKKNEKKLSTISFVNDFNIDKFDKLYLLRINPITVDSKFSDNYNLYKILLFTDTILTLKMSDNQIVVLSSDVLTGEPIPNVDIEIYLGAKKILTGQTNDKGVFILDELKKHINEKDRYNEVTVISYRNKNNIDIIKNNNEIKEKYEINKNTDELLINSNTGLEIDYLTNTSSNLIENNTGSYIVSNTDFYTGSNVYTTNYFTIGMVSNYWNYDIHPYNFGIQMNVEIKNSAYIYTDKPLYRPGQKVYIKGILRNYDDNFKILFPKFNNLNIDLLIKDPNFNLLERKKIKISKNGTFNEEFILPKDAVLGEYGIYLENNENIIINNNNYTFYVKEYEKPNYKIDIISDDDFIDKDNLKIDVLSSYYFGGNMKNANAELSVYNEDYYFDRYNGDKSYVFWDDDNYCFYCRFWYIEYPINITYKEPIYSKNKDLEDGKSTFEVPLDISKQKISQRYLLNVTIKDKNTKNFITNKKYVFVHKASKYVGLNINNSFYFNGNNIDINFVTTTYTGMIAPNEDIKLKINKIKWKNIKKQNLDGTYYYEKEMEEEFFLEKDLKTNNEGKLKHTLQLMNEGQYKIYVSIKDEKGNINTASKVLHIIRKESGFNWNNYYNDDDIKIDVVTDKEIYKVGDIAKIMIKSPFKDAYALITYEKSKVDKYEVVKINDTTYTVNIPITSDMIKDYYISFSLIQGLNFSEVPEFRQGYAKLIIDTSDKMAKIDINSDKDIYKPKEKVKLNLKVTDINDKPLRDFEMSVAVIDESLLALKNISDFDLVNYFYNISGLNVQTSNSLTKFIKKQELQAMRESNSSFIFKSQADGLGGGGGSLNGSLNENSLNENIRSVFADTAIFLPNVITDSNGQAYVEFNLPDNLTTWRVIVVGSSFLNIFGSKTYSFKVSKPLLIMPNFPRFFTVNDKMELSAVLQNNTENKLSTYVDINISSGVTLNSSSSLIIDLEPNSSKTVYFPIYVNDDNIKNIDIKLLAKSQDYLDIVYQSISKNNFDIYENVAMNGMTKSNDNVFINIPLNYYTGSTILIKLSATLLNKIDDIYKFFIEYQDIYDKNVEFHMSYAIVLKNILDILEKSNFDRTSFENIYDDLCKNMQENCDYKKVISDKIQFIIGKIYKMQKPSGGFGYSYMVDIDSDPYVSAYIYFGLKTLLNAGFNVDKSVLDSTYSFISDFMFRKKEENNIYLSYNSLSFIAYAISSKDLLDELYLDLDKLNILSKMYLLLGYISLEDNEQNLDKIKNLYDNLLNNIYIDDRYAQIKSSTNYALFENDKIKNYIAVICLIKSKFLFDKIGSNLNISFDEQVLYKLLKYVFDLDNKYLDSSYDNVWKSIMYSYYLKFSNDINASFKADVFTNKTNLISVNFNNTNIFNNFETGALITDISNKNWFNIFLNKEGKGNLFYDILLKYKLNVLDLEPINKGFDIQRIYTTIDNKPINNYKVGDILKVNLTISVPQNRYNVNIIDYIPAGAEIIDFDLDIYDSKLLEKTENDMPRCSIFGYCPFYRFDLQQYKDDKVVLYSSFLPKGIYKYSYLIKLRHVGEFNIRPSEVYQIYYPEIFGRTSFDFIKIEK